MENDRTDGHRTREELSGLIRRVIAGDAGACDLLWKNRDHLDAAALAARDGSRRAGNALCFAARPRLKRIALASGVRREDVPDLVQETLLRAHRKLRSYDPSRGPFRAWLVAIMNHTRIHVARIRARRLRLLTTVKDERRRGALAAVRPRLHDLEGSLEASGLLARLTARQRAVLVLSRIGGLSAPEIGRLLGISAAGARSIARDARRKLRQGASLT